MAANLAPTWATKAGVVFLTLNSGLAIYRRAWGDPVSVLFVAGSYTTLLLLFSFLRYYERAAPTRIGMGRRYADLVKMGLGVVACNSALAHHQAGGGDAGSLTFVFVAYAGFLTLTWLFLRRFDGHGRAAGR